MSPLQTAQALASRRIFSIAPHATVADAAEALHRFRVNALPLVTDAGVVGLVSRREIDDALHHGLSGLPVGEISAGPPPAVAPDAPASSLLPLVRRHRLLIVGTLAAPLGVLTRTTLHRALLSGEAGHNLWGAVVGHLGPLAQTLADLGQIAADRGEAALMIGGCVRDLLRNHTPNDVDVVVAGDAAGLAAAAAAALGGTASGNPAFGTAHWVTADGVELDLASARTEHYTTPGALPTVITRSSLRQDLSRRDFTINTMAISLHPAERGQLVDPYGGREDLAAGLLRVIHGLSFLDDPTRIFRAARFAARLDLDLAPGTAALMRGAMRSGVALTRQRIGNELDRIFSEASAVGAVERLMAWGVMDWIDPALGEDEALDERLAAVRAAGGDGEALWLAVACGIPADARQRLESLVVGARGRQARWLKGPDRIAAARQAIGSHTRGAAVAEAVRGLDAAEACVLAATGGAAAVAWWQSVGRHIRVAVDGRALISRGVRPGPKMGEAIAAARAVAWDGGDEDAQIAAAMAVMQE